MARIYARKVDAFRARLTIPMTEEALDRLRKAAEQRGKTATSFAREIVERGVSGESR